MSRWAVSCEHFASAAYFEVVSLPSNPLTVVEFHIFYVVPEARFGQDRAQGFLGAIDGASEAAEEPFHPGRPGARAYCMITVPAQWRDQMPWACSF